MEIKKPLDAQNWISENAPPATGKPVRFDTLVYTPQMRRADFRPSNSNFVGGLFLFGVLAYIFAGGAVLMLIRAFIGLFHWLTNHPEAISAAHGSPLSEALLGILFIVPGILFGSIIFDALRFQFRSTTFDYAAHVFRRGGEDICSLNEISAIHLKFVTDPNYPGKADVGLAVEMRDGTQHTLEPRCRFNYLGKYSARFSTIGIRMNIQKQEAARRMAAEVAQQIGVELKESQEQGSLRSQPGM